MYFVAILEYMNYMTKQDLTAGHENLRKIVNNVMSLESIANWVTKRPLTEM